MMFMKRDARIKGLLGLFLCLPISDRLMVLVLGLMGLVLGLILLVLSLVYNKWGAIDVSVTLGLSGQDVPRSFYDALSFFCDKMCLPGAVALKRGASVDHLHCQAVFRAWHKTLRAMNEASKRDFNWSSNPAGVVLVCKALKNNRLHHFEGMVGDCMKDIGAQETNRSEGRVAKQGNDGSYGASGGRVKQKQDNDVELWSFRVVISRFGHLCHAGESMLRSFMLE